MQRTLHGSKCGSLCTESLVPSVFVHFRIHVDIVEELAIPDMHLIWGYTNNRPYGTDKLLDTLVEQSSRLQILVHTVDVVHSIDLTIIVAIANDLIECLVPP